MNDNLKMETCFKYSINNGFVSRGKNERDLTENLNRIRELPVESRMDLLFIFGSDTELFAVGNQNLYVASKGRIESFSTGELHDLKKKGAGLSFKIRNHSYKVKLDSSDAADELYSSLSKIIGLKPVIRKQREKRGNGMKTFLRWVGVICAVLVVGAVAYFAGIKVGSEDSITTADSGSSSVTSSLASSEKETTSEIEQTSGTSQNTQSSSLTKGTVEGISSVVDEMQAEFDEGVKNIRKDSSYTSGAHTVSKHINNNLIDMEDYEKTGGDFYPEAVAYLEYLKETMDLFDQAYLDGGYIDETYLNAGLDHWETSKVKRQEYEAQLQKAQEEVGIKTGTD